LRFQIGDFRFQKEGRKEYGDAVERVRTGFFLFTGFGVVTPLA
jgi:hypothetical protein